MEPADYHEFYLNGQILKQFYTARHDWQEANAALLALVEEGASDPLVREIAARLRASWANLQAIAEAQSLLVSNVVGPGGRYATRLRI